MQTIISRAFEFWPALMTAVFVVGAIWLNAHFMAVRDKLRLANRFRRQLVTFALAAIGVVVFIVVLPISDSLRGQLLGLLGIVVSAAIALSSTTLIGNMMAGLMLRAVKSFRAGDYLSIQEHFGRVSEMGLLHTEIQTEDRDLITLPNLYLVTHPYRVVRSSGTIVSLSVSLGYDNQHERIKALLCEAVEKAELEEPFASVRELGDFSVIYKASGLLRDVKQLLSARARLRGAVLDVLHGAGVEVMSPIYKTTRAADPHEKILPPAQDVPDPDTASTTRPEEVVFDKAEEAEDLGALELRHEELVNAIEELRVQAKDAKEDEDRAKFAREIAEKERSAERLVERIALQSEAR